MANIYVDPTYDGSAGASDGSQTRPFTSLSQIATGGNGTNGAASGASLWSTGNSFFVKRGTTHTVTASVVPPNGTALAHTVLDAYGTGANPVVQYAGTGGTFNLANRHYIDINNIDLQASAYYALNLFNAFNIYATNCNFVGTRSAVNQAVSGANLDSLIFKTCSFKNTLASNENSAFFGSAGSTGFICTNVIFDTCSFIGSAGAGLTLKSGDSSATNSYFSGVTVTNCTFSGNGSTGIVFSSGDAVGGDTGRMCQNVFVGKNTVADNGGPGMAVTLFGGRIWGNEVKHNTILPTTGTGGLQLAGSIGVLVELNTVHDNMSGGFAFDGAGIYLDQNIGGGSFGTTKCVVRRNVIYGHNAYNAVTDTLGNASSAGIKTYHANDNEIYANIIFNNYIGIDIDSWSGNNKVLNNTLVNNSKIGLLSGWNIVPTTFRNNIVVNSAVGITGAAIGDRPNTGALTLAATTGQVVTATSSASDFQNWNVGYAIRELDGTGWGYVVAKTSNTAVKLCVMSPFNGTAKANGTWALSFGVTQAGSNDHNTFWNCGAIAGVDRVQDASDVVADPMLDAAYHVTNAILKSGALWTQNMVDFYGKEVSSPISYGAVQARPPRLVNSTRSFYSVASGLLPFDAI